MSEAHHPSDLPSLPELMQDAKWLEGTGPIYARLASAVAEAVDRQELQPGTALPAERDMAAALGISRSTVSKAMEQLRATGYISSRQGSGNWIEDRAHSRGSGLVRNPLASTHIDPRQGLVEFTAAKFPACEDVRTALHTSLTDPLLTEVLATYGYAPSGLRQLRTVIASHYTSWGFPTTPDQVLITSGAQQGIATAAAMLLKRGDDVIIEDPSYSGAIDAFRAQGAHFIALPVAGDGSHITSLLRDPLAQRAKVLYLMPSYQNPTGLQLGDAARQVVADFVQSTGVTLIEDIALSHVGPEGPPRPPIATMLPDRSAIVVDSISKIYWGGLRIGWLRSSSGVIEELTRIKSIRDLSGPLINQVMATHLIPRIGAAAASMATKINERAAVLQDCLHQHLPEWRFPHPDGGLSLWVTLPRGNASEFGQIARRFGVTFVIGSLLSPTNSHRSSMRLTYALEPQTIVTGVSRLAEAWRAYEQVLDDDSRTQVIG